MSAENSPRPALVGAVAVAAPPAAAALLALAGDRVTPAVSALVLVLVVVAAAASGLRWAGVVAALSAGVWFDFFLVTPVHSFTVLRRDDLEVTVLLLLTGLAVTELALWGRRQQARSSRQSGYLAGVLRAAELATLPGTPADLVISRIGAQITAVLGLDDCRFEAEPGRTRAAVLLHRDGSVTERGARVDVDRHGLPTDDLTVLPVEHDGTVLGRYLLTAATRHARPSTEQRRIAVTLADQVATRLARDAQALKG